MNAERFTLDTNILVYSFDRRAGSRHLLAMDIVAAARLVDCWLTLQSLSEFYAVVTRKGMVMPGEAERIVTYWLDVFPCATASAPALRMALAMATAGRASYWDALLVATAAEAGCTAILTEDLAGGTTLHGVRVLNPFDGDRLAQTARDLLAGT